MMNILFNNFLGMYSTWDNVCAGIGLTIVVTGAAGGVVDVDVEFDAGVDVVWTWDIVIMVKNINWEYQHTVDIL